LYGLWNGAFVVRLGIWIDKNFWGYKRNFVELADSWINIYGVLRMRCMKEILARCGYRCDLCPGYSGNIHGLEDKQRCSDGWFKYIGVRYNPDEIGCQGCLNEEEIADPDCPVRPCVKEKGFNTCGECQEFACENLKTRMNFFENRLGDLTKIPKKDYILFIEPYMSENRLLKIWKSVKDEK
jgi:hypothetical protein